MSNIALTQKSTSLLQIANGNGKIQYEISPYATAEQRIILAALDAPKIKSLSDRDLDMLLFAFVNKSLILLGHSRQLNGDDDQHILVSELAKLLREKWAFFSVKELQLVLEMGIRGDLKSKPEEVVFLNIEQVNSWFKRYRTENKPAAMKQLKPYEKPKQLAQTFEHEAELQSFIQVVKEGYKPTELDWICQTATHYQALDASGKLGLTLEDKKRIYEEEKALVQRNAKYNLEHVSQITKAAYSAFVSKADASNSYEKQVLTNCRIRVFREYVEKMIKA